MRRMVVLLSLLGMLAVLPTTVPGRDAAEWLKSSYLKSIHDDCRIFLEGIELFTERDYAAFLKSSRTMSNVRRQDADTYVDELRHFEKLLDSVYEEYISFKEVSLSAQDIEGARNQPLPPMEKRICQMLAYCYLRIGDIVMAQNIISKNDDILSEDFTLRIRHIDGRMRDFYLTRELTTLYKTTLSRLTTLTLLVNNFMASEIGEMSAYIRVTGYDPGEPVNILYLAYYERVWPGLSGEKKRMIHLGQIISFFNRFKYSSSSSTKPFSAGEATHYSISYQFPIIKGAYELISDNPTIMVEHVNDNVITVARMCHFKGLVKTDFRGLKNAARLGLAEETRMETNFSLFQLDKDAAYSIGQMVPYSIYALFEDKRHLGTIELLPCGQGGGCKEGVADDPAVTPVRVLDHNFVFYNDVLDLIKRNHSRYGKNIAYDAFLNRAQEDKKKDSRPVKLFPGCSSAAD